MNDYQNAIATAILILSDAFFYGYCYEIKKWFKSWLFKEYPYKGQTIVPFYRLFLQWPLDGLAIYFLYNPEWTGFGDCLHVNAPLIGMLLAWFFMVKEGFYYIILNQWKTLEDGENMYWLNRIYFSQWWFYKNDFTVKRFKWSLIIGTAILIISNFIEEIICLAQCFYSLF